MKRIKIFSSGILAGVLISFSSIAYSYATYSLNKVVGSILFSFGLLLICAFGYKLYTGQIGKVFDNKKDFLIDLLVMYFGNFIGSLLIGSLSLLIFNDSNFNEFFYKISETKIISEDMSFLKLLVLSVFCGMLVYLGVEVYKRAENNTTKAIGLMLAVTIFVLAGFSHCIANMYYLVASKLFFTKFFISVLSILIATLGNSIGAMILALLDKVIKIEK